MIAPLSRTLINIHSHFLYRFRYAGHTFRNALVTTLKKGEISCTHLSRSDCIHRSVSSLAWGALWLRAGVSRASSDLAPIARLDARVTTHVRAVCLTASFVSANLEPMFKYIIFWDFRYTTPSHFQLNRAGII